MGKYSCIETGFQLVFFELDTKYVEFIQKYKFVFGAFGHFLKGAQDI